MPVSPKKLSTLYKTFWKTRDANTTLRSSTAGENLLSQMTGWRDADNPGPAGSRSTVYSPPPSVGRLPNGFEPSSNLGSFRQPPEGGQFRLANLPPARCPEVWGDNDWRRIVGDDINAFHSEWHKAGAGPVRDSLEAYWRSRRAR